jgi:hypothetical protein
MCIIQLGNKHPNLVRTAHLGYYTNRLWICPSKILNFESGPKYLNVGQKVTGQKVTDKMLQTKSHRTKSHNLKYCKKIGQKVTIFQSILELLYDVDGWKDADGWTDSSIPEDGHIKLSSKIKTHILYNSFHSVDDLSLYHSLIILFLWHVYV